jgi:lysophospholipid acyltransferase (LPLAT)-like uncharacterized protein
LRPLKSDGVLRAAAALFAAYTRLTLASLRWTHVNDDIPKAVWAKGGPAILCLWHQGIPLSAPTWPAAKGAQELQVLISQSKDGEFIAQVMQRLGFGSIRGSSKKKSDLAKNKNGEQAFRDMVRCLQAGKAVAVTPDGPRGPALEMQKGVAALARVTGAPVLMVGLAAAPCSRLGTWDRTIVPAPFGRAAMVWGGPFHAGRDDDADALTAEWTQRLRDLDAQAQAIVAGDKPLIAAAEGGKKGHG